MREFPARSRSRRVLVALVPAVVATILAACHPAPATAQQAMQPDPFWKPAGQAPQAPSPAPAQPATPATPTAHRPAGRARPAAAAVGGPAVIARVGGQPITQLDFDRLAQPYMQRLQAQMGTGFTPEIRRMANTNVLDELIRRQMLAIEAQRQKIEVTQADMDGILMMDPFFQTDGKFDPGKLAAFKANPTTNYTMVLPRIREMAAVRKLDESLHKRFTPTPEQVRTEWNARNTQVRFKSLPLLTRDMPLEPETGPAEWAPYYQAHLEQFMRRSRVRLRYQRLPLPAEGDSTRPAALAKAMEQARSLADSLRHGALSDSSSAFLDTGLFDVPGAMVPGIGRLPALSDTLARIDADSTIRVVGPYDGRDAVIVGVVAERQGRRVPPLAEVIGDVKRRADADKRRTANEAERRAYFDASRDQWKGSRVTFTRVTFKTPGAAAAARVAAGLRTTRDVQALAKASGGAAETLSFFRTSPPDSVFGPVVVDSLLASAVADRGVVKGPRTLGAYTVVWRVDAVDTTFVPTYEQVRMRADAAFTDHRRKQDEEEGRAYFEQHRADYKSPERFALDYVAIAVPPADSVVVPDADVRHEYDANPKKYTQEEQVKARHILFTTRGATPEVEARAKVRADSLLAAIRKDGGDFTELAKRFSQEPGAADRGGDLGWFGRGRMVKEFEEAAFALKPGEVSNVVKSQFGYHIIKVEDRKAAGAKPFDDAKAEIRMQLATARADSTSRTAADLLGRALARGGDEKVLAAGHGGVVAASPISATEPIPSLGFPQGLATDLPAMVPGKWAPGFYRTGNHYLVVRLRERIAPRPAEFGEVTAQATEDMKNTKRRVVLAQKVEAVRSSLASGGSLDSLAAPFGGLKDSGYLGASAGYVPLLGAEPRVVQRAIAMKPGQVSDTLQVAAGVVWLRVEDHKSGDAATYKAAAAQIEAEIATKKYNAWVDERKKIIKVEILRPDLRAPRPPVFGAK